MSKTRDTGYLANVIQVHDTGVRIMSGSTMLMAVSSSGAVTITGEMSGSDAANALLLSGTGSVGFTTTSSFLAVSSSQQQVSASYISLSGSYNVFSGSASTRITVDSASLLQVSSSQQQISASLLQVSASYTALSGSYNNFSGSASTRTTQIEQVYATTGSNSFRANQSITGSLVVSSTITAQTLVVQTVTSSIVYSSGSNIFGCDLNSRQTFTGSVLITGSLTIAGASSATSYSGATIFGSTIACSPIGCFTTSCATAFIGGTMCTTMANASCIGIGTQTPLNKFDVIINSSNSGVSTSGISISDGAANRTLLFMGVNTGNYTYIQSNQDNVASKSLILNGSGGCVGIGTTSPAELLEVSGSLKIGNLKIQNSDGGRIGFNRNTSTGAIYNCCYAAFQINGAYLNSNYLDFQNYNSSGSYVGGFVFKDGCIGIGTTNPTGTYGKLSVAGGISILDDNTAKLEIGRYSSGVPNSYIKMGTNACSLKFTNNIDSIDLVTIEKCGAVLINTACKNYLGTPNRYGIEVNGGTGGVIYALNISNTPVGYIFHDNSNLTIWNDKSGGPILVGPRFNNNGLQEQVYEGKMGGTTATSWDFCSFEEGGEGQVYKVEATFAHFAGWSYNTFYEGYAAARGTTVNTIDICNYATAQAGYFSVMKPTGSIFRVCKIAGSYGGTGWYWVKVTAVGPGF